jgi:hypothetical protein
MKNTLGLAIVLLAASACDDAASRIQTTEEGSPAIEEAVGTELVEGTPAFSFDSEFHDFGEITEGTVAEHIFRFTNTGDAPLIISNAQGSCGCTVPDWPRNPIAPGDQGEIKVSFNSSGRQGKNDKQVTLNANTIPNTRVLKITSSVLPNPNKANTAQ